MMEKLLRNFSDLGIILEVLCVPDTLLNLFEEGESRPAVLRDRHDCVHSLTGTFHNQSINRFCYLQHFKYDLHISSVLNIYMYRKVQQVTSKNLYRTSRAPC